MLAYCSAAFSKTVDQSAAALLATRFLQAKGVPAAGGLTLSYTQCLGGATKVPLYFVYTCAGGGFVLVGADDELLPPVLAWSPTDSFVANAIPPHIASWLDHYTRDAAWQLAHSNLAKRYTAQWQQLKAANAAAEKATLVTPLLACTWNQNGYYNIRCPYDTISKKYALTGCVATAMAQIMRFWQWPAAGIGFHAYIDSAYGLLWADFSRSNYNWNKMPNAMGRTDTPIAQLMYDAGVSVDMDYGVTSSSAYVLAENCPIRNNAQFALVNYFCYQPSMRDVFRVDYNDQDWINVIEQELNAGRPMMYSGTNDSEGHSFIADGYDAQNRIHFNWGWGGAYNGYFTVESIAPDSISFMQQNSLLMGIQPDRTRALVMANAIEATDLVRQNSQFQVVSKVINVNQAAYSGNVTLMITGDYFPFFSDSQLVAISALNSGDSFALNLNLSGLPSGSYHAQLFYRNSSGGLLPVDSTADFSQVYPLEVFGSASSPMTVVLIPNPAATYCYITLKDPGASSYAVYDEAGATVAGGNVGPQQAVIPVPVGFLRDGVYVVKVMMTQGVAQQKLVVKH